MLLPLLSSHTTAILALRVGGLTAKIARFQSHTAAHHPDSDFRAFSQIFPTNFVTVLKLVHDLCLPHPSQSTIYYHPFIRQTPGYFRR
jgi:hypothetical protein